MQTLYLNVENTVKIQLCACCIINILCKICLVFSLDLCKALKNVLVVFKESELGKLLTVLLEAFTDIFGKKVCKSGVGLE